MQLPFRTGFGYDVHRLVEDRELWLCGVKIEYEKGLLGHSNADVALHALCDAFLGAAALRDIGYHFPDSDPQFKGIDSKKLLTHVIILLRKNGYIPGNADITICCERPKISPYIEAMKEAIALCTGMDTSEISVKATTTEGLGFTGRKEGIAAYASVLIYRDAVNSL